MAKYVGAQPRVSGNRIDGGTITTFQSTGIDDSASTVTNLTITDTTQTQTGNIVNTASSGSHTFNTDAFVVDIDNERIGVGKVPTQAVDVIGENVDVRFSNDGSAPGPNLRLYRDSASPTVDDDLACIQFFGKNTSAGDIQYARITGRVGDATAASENGRLDITVQNDGTEVSIFKMKSTEVIVNDDQVDMDFIVRAQSAVDLFHVNAGTARVGIGTANPTELLHVVGDVKIDGTIVFSNQASGAGSATFTIQDEINSANNAYAAVEFQDSTGLNMAQFALFNGKAHITSQHGTTGAAGIHFGLGYTSDTGEDYEYMMMMEQDGAETTITSGATNISFDNTTGKITSGTSGYFTTNFSLGEVVKIEGAGQSANNRSWRILEFADTGSSVVVIDRRGAKPTTESAGASITVKKHSNFVKIPDTVNHFTWTAPQTENSQLVASTAYVRTAVANLIDSSPATLDTLDELAAALGDDANYATNTANALTNRVNIDFDNLSTTGEESLRDYIGTMVAAGDQTFTGTGNSVSITHDDANDEIDIAISVNAFDIATTLSGDVTGSGTVTVTDLQNATLTISNMAIAAGTVTSTSLVSAPSLTNIITGLTRITSIQNSDDLIVADADDGGALKKVARSIVAPPGLDEGLGFFAIAMS
jgi:hypothetical protein